MTDSRKTRQLLESTGKALYGPRWQADLARDLGVSYRTMQRWSSGEAEVSEKYIKELLGVVRDRQAEMECVEMDIARLIIIRTSNEE